MDIDGATTIVLPAPTATQVRALAWRRSRKLGRRVTMREIFLEAIAFVIAREREKRRRRK